MIPRRARRGILAGLLVGTITTGGAAWLVERDAAADRRQELAAVQAYLAGAEPLANRGGRIVQEELKRALGDLRRTAGRVNDLVAGNAEAWRRDFGGIRASWAALATPPSLLAAQQHFLASLDGYAGVAATIREAARVTGPARIQLLDQVIDAGLTSDRRFDDAARIVQDRLRALGAQPVSWLPGTGSGPTRRP